MSDFLDSLNPEQKKAVLHFTSPLLVLAGAGSGKTRVITNKIMFLTKELGIPLNRILAITFTNKAANEMKERVKTALNIDTEPQWISTFHSLAAKILRLEAHHLGYDKNFVIYDEEDTKKTIKEVLEELNLDKELYKPEKLKEIISQLKQSLNQTDVLDFFSMQYPHIKKIYSLYQEKLALANAMDFDDILLNVVKLFEEKPEVKKRWQNKFDYILVDEYQDTNKVQHQILKHIVGNRDCITVVGDPQQCIYTWRGANPENILDFERDFPNTTVIKLERNYRSTKKILEAANKLISSSKGKWKKKVLTLWTDKDEGEDIKLFKLENDKQEAGFIALYSKKFLEKGYNYSDIAVLIRMSFLSRNLEEAFIKAGIPYQIVGGLKFYERAEVKDILAYLRFAFNPKDTQAFKRIINLPSRGIGKKTLEKIETFYVENWLQAVEDALPSLKGKAKSSLEEFLQLIKEIRQNINQDPAKVANYLYQTINYENYLKEKYPKDWEDRVENVKELFRALEELSIRGKTLEQFLEETSLQQAQDSIQQQNSVKIMTVHASKGLEFPIVFVAGVEDGIFPSGRAFDDPYQMEEERRLFYVAITRAKEHLILTMAKARSSFGNSFQTTKPSRFLKEIKEHIKVLKPKTGKQPKKKENQPSPPSTGFMVGQLVKHDVFGKGVIKELTPPKAKVIFENVGEKELLTKFLKKL